VGKPPDIATIFFWGMILSKHAPTAETQSVAVARRTFDLNLARARGN
jgi:hypothetical protein